MPRIFVSYAREDFQAARDVYANLRAMAGIEVWFDKESLLPGQNWTREIRAAIESADAFLLLLSKASIAKRGFYQREVREALDVLKELPEGRLFLIPARLDECEPHFEELRQIHYVDLFPDLGEGLAKVVAAVNARVTSPPQPFIPKVRLTTHLASFVGSPEECYFLTLVNLEPVPVEVTHLWYEDEQHHIPVDQRPRPLPKRLATNESWSSWIGVRVLPVAQRDSAHSSFRARLSAGQVVTSVRDDTIPPYGSVPGGPIETANFRGQSPPTLGHLGDVTDAPAPAEGETVTHFRKEGLTIAARNSPSMNIVFGDSHKSDGQIIMRLSFVMTVDFDSDLMIFRVDYHQGRSEKLYWDRGGQIKIDGTAIRISDGLLEPTRHMDARKAYVVGYSQTFFGKNDIDGRTTWTDYPKLGLRFGFSNGRNVQTVGFLNPGGELIFSERGWNGPVVH